MRRTAWLLLPILAAAMTTAPAHATAPATLERGAFIDYPVAHARGGHGGGAGNACTQPASDLCTDFKDGRFRWSSLPVRYEINTTGAPSGAAAAIQAGFSAWENETKSASVAQVYGADASSIDYTYGGTTSRTGPVLDEHNVVSFANISSWCSGCLAVTSYWYYTGTRTLAEFDITFNTQYPWSTNGAASSYDVQDIATHESGHSLVLGDLYKASDAALTMYGYGDVNETSKQDLGAGDVLGVRKAYPG